MQIDVLESNILNWVKMNLSPSFTFRENQLETIKNIINNVISNVESNQVIEAPTGSGKSVIILISAGVLNEYYNKRSYILCSDLSLWKQYYDFIKENKLNFGYLKGQLNNYYCKANNNPIRCAECRIAGKSWAYLMTKQNNEYPCAGACQYIKDRRHACLSNVTLMTYQCFLYSLMHQEKDEENDKKNLYNITPREVIFCDECHHMSDVVMPLFSPHIYPVDIEIADKVYTTLAKEVDLPKSPAEFKNNLMKYAEELKSTDLTNKQNLELVTKFYNEYSILWNAVKDRQEYYITAYKRLNPENKSKVTKLYKSFENIVIYGDQFRDLLKYLESEEFLIKEVLGEQLTFYNLKQDFLVYKALLNKASHRIMLSATVGNIEAFKDDIGIKYLTKKDTSFTRVPSIFDFTKSPIIIYDQYKLNYYNKPKLFPKIKELTYKICKQFAEQKGIIQTTSYTDALDIYNSAPADIKKRLSVYSNSTEKEEILKKHLSKKNSILLGPTLNEGLDLPDDLCRFIIITKIPYPQLTSEFIKKKLELFKGWYQSITSLKVIQTIGRGVRNEKDYCQTFILDACFFDLFMKTKDQYADEIQKRFVIETINNV